MSQSINYIICYFPTKLLHFFLFHSIKIVFFNFHCSAAPFQTVVSCIYIPFYQIYPKSEARIDKIMV